MQIFHIYDLPHSDTVPVKGTINDKYNIIIQCQISLLFFFLFFYSNYNAIALPSILKVTMTLPSPCPASFRSCPCQKKQLMTSGKASAIPVQPNTRVTSKPPHLLVDTGSKPSPPFKRKNAIIGNT